MPHKQGNSEQNAVVPQTDAQRNPYLARPEDFKVSRASESAKMAVPRHGQHGDSAREQERLLKQGRPAAGRDAADMATQPDDAALPKSGR